MNRAWSVLLLAAIATARPNVAWRGQFTATYDDNPFCYSDSDLERFRLRANPAKFPIRTTDDLDLTTVFGARWLHRILHHSGSIAVAARLHQYVSNPAKSYGVTSVEAGESVWHDGRLSIAYTFMPSYLIRYYRTPGTTDTTLYTGCSFTEHLAGFRLRQRLGRVALEPGYHFEYDDYVSAFGFYDSKVHRLALDGSWAAADGLVFSGSYEYRAADAAGPVPDISYGQHSVEVSVRTIPRKLRRFNLEVAYELAERRFTTENSAEADPGHAGRSDRITDLSVDARYSLGFLSLLAAYGMEWREVKSPYSSQIEDVKDYRAARAKLGVLLNSRGSYSPW